MLFNHSVYDSREVYAFVPLYTRLMKESERLQDYLKTVEEANAVAEGSAEAEQFSNLYLRKLLTQMSSPRDFFCIKGSDKLNVKPRRRSDAYMIRYVAENLHKIFTRISIDDLYNIRSGSKRSRLFKNLDYYRMSLQVVARALEVGSESEDTSKPRQSIKQRLGRIRVISDRLSGVPANVIDQFDEKTYLQNNIDVRAAVAENEVVSGLEHFAVQGMQEVLQGGRAAPGIDLGLMVSASSKSGAGALRETMATLKSSGIFDAKWYKRSYGVHTRQLKHYCQTGYKLKHAPNALFDVDWYLKQNATLDVERVNPAYHYVQYGEVQGSTPCEQFSPLWYKNQYGVTQGLALAHYMREGIAKGFNPNPLFDRAYYLEQNADVVNAKIDPVDHFYGYGWKERRNPSAHFDADLYVVTYLNNASEINPVTHALLHKNESAISQAVVDKIADPALTAEARGDENPARQTDIASAIKYFANPGPGFEVANEVDNTTLKSRAKTVAFYLPQFHAFEENDEWWGAGFTEWRNVIRGTPRYEGHYQPRVPRDLGFYDLNNEKVLIDQAKMAQANGIEAFCFYYYWFNGKRLLDMPLDSFVSNKQIDQEFCIMWANENWTRTWDGFDNEVLMDQSYRDEDEAAFLEDTANYFQHERYMRVDGRPLFILYRPGLLPASRKTLARWRDAWEEMLGVAPWILMVQGFGDEDPGKFGIDGAVEFPPHKVCVDLPQIQSKMNVLDPNYSGEVRAYTDVIDSSLSEKPPEFPLIKTVVPHWDNDARREGRGFTMHGSTPKLYESWLKGAIDYAEENPFADQPIVFINAWNEWAEGAYLEPDVHYGHAYLNATQRAVYGLASAESRQKLLLVGHDAYKHGAQMLLLSMAEVYKHQFGMDVTILLKSGGPLLKKYQKICNTFVVDTLGKERIQGWLLTEGFSVAICNTSVTGDLLPALDKAGVEAISLIHELPNLIMEYKLENHLQSISEHASHVVFPSDIVQDGFNEFVEGGSAKHMIQPQGTYKKIEFDAEKRSKLRGELGISADEKIVLNVGFADLRKGFDIFLKVAQHMVKERPEVHFVWAGQIAPDMKRWVESDLDAGLRDRIHLIGFTDKMEDYYSACDCLFLTSREDPYPTVVLEAMDVGAPVVLFKRTTGFDSLIGKHGQLVDRNDMKQMTRALVHSLYNDSRAQKLARQDHVNKHSRFDDYCFKLLQMLHPDLKKVSVVVPNYNYEEYMHERLNSVFAQNYPIFETIVLDDCSSDDSIAEIKRVAKNARRIVDVQTNKTNSGNVFRQWSKGLAHSRGDVLWIAEADDLAEPTFVDSMLQATSDDTALAFCNSSQIDTDGTRLAKNYDYYYNTVDKKLFSKSFQMTGPDFINQAMAIKNVIMNVSSVLWNKQALERALDNIGDEITDYKLVGDWRLYLEVLSDPKNSIAYVSEPLNVHRRHAASVTHSLDHERHLSEICAMHKVVSSVVDIDGKQEIATDAYVDELKQQFGLDEQPKSRFGKAA